MMNLAHHYNALIVERNEINTSIGKQRKRVEEIQKLLDIYQSLGSANYDYGLTRLPSGEMNLADFLSQNAGKLRFISVDEYEKLKQRETKTKDLFRT